jgi:hypothetical protein
VHFPEVSWALYYGYAKIGKNISKISSKKFGDNKKVCIFAAPFGKRTDPIFDNIERHKR